VQLPQGDSTVEFNQKSFSPQPLANTTALSRRTGLVCLDKAFALIDGAFGAAVNPVKTDLRRLLLLTFT
jgi:hypothetical protein